MTDLTDRMRTCAAHILREAIYIEGELPPVYRDAADLLIEAADALEAAPAPLGEPMEIIPPQPFVHKEVTAPMGTWVVPGGPLPGAAQMRPPRACPRCDSRATKTVRRIDNRLMLACHICGHEWPLVKRPLAGGTESG